MTDTTVCAVRATELGKTFGSGETGVTALHGVDVRVPAARFATIMGPSGSGKSTLMHCLAGLDRPTTGTAWIGETDLSTLDDDALTELRRDRVGFVFQSFNLIPTLTAWENMTLPLDLAGRRPAREVVSALVDTLGLRERLGHRPDRLSGGQRQRVACARALITEPDVVFADEPTGALDSESSAELLAFLRRGVTEFGRTVVMVTHDPAAAAYADRVLFLADGRLVDEMPAPTADGVLDRMKSLERMGT